MGCMSWYGGCISASSISVMPADQISACQKNISTTSVYLRFKFQKGTTREGYNSVKNITANIKL